MKIDQTKLQIFFSFAVLIIWYCLVPVAIAQTPGSETISFTDPQVAEGKAAYEINCAACHGLNLEGAAVVPNLSGESFATKWSAAPLNELAIELRQMPPGGDSRLDDEDYAAIAAYILSFNGVPAAPNAPVNRLSLESDAVLTDLNGNRQVEIETSIAGSAAAVLQKLTPVTDAMLNDPPAQDWLLWQSSYDNQGFSSLDQINRESVNELKLNWRMPLQVGENNPGPLVHDGIMFFFTFPDTVLAIDATNGSLLWRYQHQSEVRASQKKGVALHAGRVYVPTSDLHVLALNAKTGELIWDHEIETEEGLSGYHLRMAPFVVGNTVMQGITSLRIAKGGWVLGLDIDTGEKKMAV